MTTILVFIIGYFPVAITFDSYESCHEFQHSLELQVQRRTVIDIFTAEHLSSTPDFIPCTEI